MIMIKVLKLTTILSLASLCTTFSLLRSKVFNMDRIHLHSSTSSELQINKSIFIFGLGYVGSALAKSLKSEGWKVSGTSTNVLKIRNLKDDGINAYLFDDENGKMIQPEAITDLTEASYIINTIPPSQSKMNSPYESDSVLAQHSSDIKRAALGGNLKWIGYISSTGVYGDRSGAWVTEQDDIRPDNDKTKLRAAAESSWRGLFSRSGLPVHIFRVAGIYGPGRSAIDTVRKYK